MHYPVANLHVYYLYRNTRCVVLYSCVVVFFCFWWISQQWTTQLTSCGHKKKLKRCGQHQCSALLIFLSHEMSYIISYFNKIGLILDPPELHFDALPTGLSISVSAKQILNCVVLYSCFFLDIDQHHKNERQNLSRVEKKLNAVDNISEQILRIFFIAYEVHHIVL